MKNQMLHDIAMNGYTRLEDMEDDPVNKTTLNTVNVFLLGMGLESDLVTKGLMLKNTLKEEQNTNKDSIALIACKVGGVRLIDNLYLGE